MPCVYLDPLQTAKESKDPEVLRDIVKHSGNPTAVSIAKEKLERLSRQT
jgi:hypothetical protein